MEDKLTGGLADGKTIKDIAKLHKVPLTTAKKNLARGIEIELEHTTDRELAEEIALDHLYEDILYYDKLKSIEETLINRLRPNSK